MAQKSRHSQKMGWRQTPRAVFLLLFLTACAAQLPKTVPYNTDGMDRQTRNVHKKAERLLRECVFTRTPVQLDRSVRIDSVRVDPVRRTVRIDCNKSLSMIPFRPDNTAKLYTRLRKLLGRKYRSYDVRLCSLQTPIEELIPNVYRLPQNAIDRTRLPRFSTLRPQPLLNRVSQPWRSTQGLQERNIALWHSHGWYYANALDRWEWQRPRLFVTVEDLLPLSFVLPYLVPMLEDAGATVFLPRERDTQNHRVIVDNDSVPADEGSVYCEERDADGDAWQTGAGPGFAVGTPPYLSVENPFQQGTYRTIACDSLPTAHVEWIPDIPADGEYMVAIAYVSSPQSILDAHYTVDHLGGRTEFVINQQIGGGTWIYLGTFAFRAGVHRDCGRVMLTNQSRQSVGVVTADAVRFGGGMGEVARNGRTSGRPKFLEAARYYLQTAGMPDTLVYNLNGNQDDYKDDYQSRGEWVNYLIGAPYGPNIERSAAGLGIPIDLSLAFHTDAGISRNDTTIGTLSIYSFMAADSQRVFPDSVSRLANRDLADLVQTQLVEDIRALYDPVWQRRQLMDGDYSEAFRPNVPSMLLELLSHQNYLDMHFALDPRFRFSAARSIYKGFLRFIAFQNGFSPVVTPLPVTHLSAEWSGPGQITLSWRPQFDPLEPTAVPDGFIVYRGGENGGFDNGTRVEESTAAIDDLLPGQVTRIRVAAVNAGGKSFPSAVLAVCWMGEESPKALVIDAFDRICAPQGVESDGFAGFLLQQDAGVPEGIDFGLTGEQFDFDPQSSYRVNDAPGHGASFANFETTLIPGNTRDFAVEHVAAFKACGYSALTVSDEAAAESQTWQNDYQVVDLLLGEERRTLPVKVTAASKRTDEFQAFPPPLQARLTAYCRQGGNLLISGAYVATDLFMDRDKDHPDIEFGRSVLKIDWVTNHAARHGQVQAVHPLFPLPQTIRYSAAAPGDRYPVEAPDAFTGVDGAFTVMRYAENGFSAATAYDGDYRLIVLGFPFESILSAQDRESVMRSALAFFAKPKVVDSGS